MFALAMFYENLAESTDYLPENVRIIIVLALI